MYATEATRVAIECLTLWLEPGQEARHRAAEHIADVTPDTESKNQLIGGLLNLSMLLVLKLAKETNPAATDDDLLERAGDILRHWSPRLPE